VLLVVVVLLVSCFLFRAFAAGRAAGADLPTVTGAAVPLYPPPARAASVQAVVILKFTTSGDKIESTTVLSGHPLLPAAAELNIRTWTFIGNPPQTVEVTYRYKIRNQCTGTPSVKTDFPNEVTICSRSSPPID
jgi:hypothetical protein